MSEEIQQDDEEVKKIVKTNTKKDRIIIQKGGMLDGTKLVSDNERFRELTDSGSEDSPGHV